MNKKIIVFDDVYDVQTKIEERLNIGVRVDSNPNKVITIYERGKQGAKGNPQFNIINDTYIVDKSISFSQYISSSIIPTGSFSIGNLSNPFETIYINNLNVGGHNIIEKTSEHSQTFLIQSGSVSASFDANGIFKIPEFDYLPLPVSAGLIKSGSNFFIGI